MSDWEKVTEWERSWWGLCTNTLGEEEKQLIYSKYMGLKSFRSNKSPYNYDLEGAKVIDIGGGPVSILLKCINFNGTVLDPCDYPNWVALRYQEAGIKYLKQKAEDLDVSQNFDLALMYNVLQHTEDPQRIIQNIKKVSKVIRIFEWVLTEKNSGHPHSFTEEIFDNWLGGTGKTVTLKGEGGCYGTAFYGIFKGDNFE